MTADFFDIHVKVTPKASANRIGETREGPGGISQLMVYVTAAPDRNKANESVIALLAAHFGVPKSAIAVLRGHTGRNKVVRIARP
ncbi:MAG: DUF167 domain-containing protein [Alphaproteobacteria bacterium]